MIRLLIVTQSISAGEGQGLFCSTRRSSMESSSHHERCLPSEPVLSPLLRLALDTRGTIRWTEACDGLGNSSAHNSRESRWSRGPPSSRNGGMTHSQEAISVLLAHRGDRQPQSDGFGVRPVAGARIADDIRSTVNCLGCLRQAPILDEQNFDTRLLRRTQSLPFSRDRSSTHAALTNPFACVRLEGSPVASKE